MCMKKVLALILLSWTLTASAFWQDLTAKSWLVADGSGKILQHENIYEVRSIASISKLMTVMVVLDAKQDLDQYIKPYTRRELIQLSLVKSDNTATQTLCDNYPGGKRACVSAMNYKAQELDMPNTRFIESTGLSVFNVSTADELIKLVLKALSSKWRNS